jgi:S-adenosylmethionine hydrolase
VSATFHGRDVFAPVAAHLAMGAPFASVGPVIAPGALIELRLPGPDPIEGGIETTVAFVDPFGNLRLFATTEDLARAMGPRFAEGLVTLEFPAVDDAAPLVETVAWSRTFGERPIGASLLYEDSSGLVAFADNQGSAAERMGVRSGRRVRLHSGRP